MTIKVLTNIIRQRIAEKPSNSYVCSLVSLGPDAIIQKIGEEACEVIIATKNQSKDEIIAEMADLWFHALVLLVACDIDYRKIFEELEKRNT